MQNNLSIDSIPIKSLSDYKGLNYALYRQATRTDTSINTFTTDIDPITITKQEIISLIQSDKNIDLLTRLIISKNSIGLSIDIQSIHVKVSNIIKSWIDMGKFDKPNSFISFQHLVDYYNKEFIQEFAHTILPIEVTKVKSITNPNGMYAQQSRTLSYKSKPPPFWERALYKRLEDRVRDIPMDETEGPFYKFENTGKKIPESTKIQGIYERETPSFRMTQ